MKTMNEQDKNENYFNAFGQTRGSVGMLHVAWAGFFIGLLELWPLYVTARDVEHINPWSSKVNVLLLIIIIFMAVCLILSLEGFFIYKHQKISSILFACFTFALTFELAFMGLMMVAFLDGMNWGSMINNAYLILVIGTYVISLIYNIIWIKKQLTNGFSEERAEKNYLASKIYESNSQWFIFGCTILGGMLTGIGERIFVFAAETFLVAVFSRLNVETSYLAYLRIKDKKYWGEIPEKQKFTKKEWRAARLKWYKRINVVLCIGIIAGMGRFTENRELMQWEKFVGRVATINLCIVIILWIIKKYSKWKEKRK